MAYNFKSCNRSQGYLLPPTLSDWLAEDHLAWFIIDAIEQIDISVFYENYRSDGVGNTAFDPAMMLTLLMYAYSTGERSSRRLEKFCQSDVAYRVITANEFPDHTTISRFRKKNQQNLKKVFLEILRLCGEADLVKLGKISLDGTKMKANASLSANRTLKKLQKEIDKMFWEADKTDRQEDLLYGQGNRGDEMPEELQTRNSRRKRLEACKQRLEEEAQQARQEQQKKLDEREEKEKQTGKKPRGRKPKSPDEVEDKEAKANPTDPESRIVKTRKGYEQGYNAQAVVTENQIIIAEDVTQQANDQKQLHPMIEQTELNRKHLGIDEKLGVLLADAGYCSEENLTSAPAGDVELLVATQKDWKQRKAAEEAVEIAGPPPKGTSATELMEQTLRTERGRTLYKLRSQTVEPVFGQIKSNRGIDGFLRRGIEACRSEWSLICATHNLLKLYRSGKAAWLTVS